MNMNQRNHIATKSDADLKSDIERYTKSMTKGRHLSSIRISQNKRLQAHLDELQSRMINA